MKFITVFIVVLIGTCYGLPTSSASSESNNFQLTDYVEFLRNSYESNEVEGRSSNLEDNIEEVLKSYDVTFKLPFVGSAVTLNARNLDNEELDLKVKINSDGPVEARKSKLKKVIAPIFVFILIKAMVLIPLALGILAIKTWNALQLSFVSFVIALGLGVWQLCKKVADNSVPAHIVAHEPWSAARSFNDNAQKLAYSAYVKA